MFAPRFDSTRVSAPTLLPLLGLALAGGLSACGGGSGTEDGGTPTTLLAPDFELRTDVLLSMGGLSDALAVDLNGDGVLDIVETNFFDRTLSIGMGDGLGEFVTASVIAVDGYPSKLATGDFDGDGLRDLAVTLVDQVMSADPCVDCTGPQVAVLQQDAGGIFSVTASIELDVPPTDLVAAPLSGGPQDDLVVTQPGSRAAWVLQLVGPGVVQVVSLIEDTGGQPLSAAVLDVDHDGLLDVILGELGVAGAPDRVALYRGDAAEGPGNYDYDQTLVPIAGSPIVRLAGDVDGDGYEDVSVAQFGDTSAQLLLGGPAGLSAPISVDFGAVQSTVLFQDLDGDGLAEAAAALFEQGALVVVTPSAALDWANGEAVYYNVGSFPRALAAPDFGGDGLADLFCSNAGDVSIAYAQAPGEFRAAHGYALGSLPAMVQCADFDGNGTKDAVSIDVFNRLLVFMSGKGDGTFERVGTLSLETAATETPGFLAVGDFDGDDDLDLVSTIFQTGEIQVLRNAGGLPFATPEDADRVQVGNEPTGLASGDVDGDGDPDLVVANSADHSVQVLLGDGTGAFAPQPAIMLSVRTIAVLLEDLDGDGHLDLAVTTGKADGTGASVRILKGDGAAGFTEVASVPLTDASSELTAADFDGDGRVDLAVGQSTQQVSEVFVLMNQGALSFASQAIFVGANPGTIEVADVNGDGALDLIVPLGIGELRLVLGDGAGGFPTVLPLEVGQLPVPYGTTASAYEDVDGDGLRDLLLISVSTPYLWVGRNVSTPISD